MRKNLLAAASLSVYLALAGCAVVTSHTGEPSKEALSNDDVDWPVISDNQDEIVQQAQQFIQSRHPKVDQDFPNLQIRSVSFGGVPSSGDSEVQQILQSLTSKILGTRPRAPTWELDVNVNFHYHRPNNTVAAIMAVPEGVICFSTIFSICPEHSTEEVAMEVHVTLPDGRQTQFASAGYGEIYESTLMLEDNQRDSSKRIVERNTKGLVAAIVGSADKVVEVYKNSRKSP